MRKTFLLFVMLFCAPLFIYSQFDGYKFKGGLQFNYLYPTTELTSNKFSFLGRGFVNFELNNTFELELGLGYGQLRMTDELTGYPNTGEVANDIIPMDVRLRIAPFPGNTFNPYLWLGLGALSYNVTKGENTHNLVGENEVNTTPPGRENGWSAILPTAGIGTEIKLSDQVLLDVNAGYSYYTSDKVNNIVWGKMLDGAVNIGTGLTFTGKTDADPDKDGLLSSYEDEIGTDPENPDTDGDGLNDGDEVNKYYTNPLNKDSDNDDLNDYDEVIKYSTNPVNPDTDGEKLRDGEEVLTHKTDPNKADTDNDGLNDFEELNNYKTDPLKADTDSDELKDGDEVNKHKTNPLVADTDKGSVKDGAEIKNGTNPLDPNDDVKKEEIKVGQVVVLEGINFETNSAKITPDSEATLKKALDYMKNSPNESFEISGHTDSRGTKSKNQKLSEDRAKSVKDWLVKNGIEASRLTAVGYGPDNPLVPNTTADNMLKNRRIEFKRTK